MTLTEEILDNISAYKMEFFDAEENVILAHMEATFRDIQIQMECKKCGIVMEGDIIPERDGENIFKYILLFIPRLIINLMRKLREWITGVKEPDPKEIARKTEEAAAKALEDGYLDHFINWTLSTANQIVHKNHPTTTGKIICDRTKGYEWKYEWKLIFDNVVNKYMTYCGFFKEYAEMFNKLADKKEIIYDDETANFESELALAFNGVEKAPVVRTGSIETINAEKATKYYGALGSGGLDDLFTEIANGMRELNKKYAEMTENRKKIAESNMAFATNWIGQIRRVYSMFVQFDMNSREEIGAAYDAFQSISLVIDSYMMERKKRYIDDEKMNEKDAETATENLRNKFKAKGVIK